MIDAVTLFLANGIVLLVLAGVFATAWAKQPEATYFGSWVTDKLVLVTSMVVFVIDPQGATPATAALANMLLVAGLGFRWRAARQFNGRPAPWLVSVILPVLVASARALSPAVLPYAAIFCLTNALLAAFFLAAAWEFWRDRADGLVSRYVLAVSNGICCLTFLARPLQGLVPAFRFESVLTDDAMMTADLLIALVYVVVNGTFSLSLAYERSLSALRQAAFTDALTGLPNRRAFEARFAAVTASGKAGSLALAMLDIDHFKAINDRHGHATGDRALKACASAIRGSLPAGAFAARVGGEEFAVLMVGITAVEARRGAEAIRIAVAQAAVAADQGAVALTVSIGLHHASGTRVSFDHAMHQADLSLYRAKVSGRDRVVDAAA